MKAQVVVFSLLAGASCAFAQGSLTPPGAPGQTMKSLAQIEPRTVIPGGTASFTITTPGSYVLGGNITVAEGTAIQINSGNVTLDLNGFTISSTPASTFGRAITLAPNISNIRITNGHIVGSTTYDDATHTFAPSGFEYGIGTEGYVTNAEIDHVTVSGVKFTGISSSDAFIHDCSVTICGRVGILADRVSDCQARNTGLEAINAVAVSGCVGHSVGLNVESHGIVAMVISDSIGSAVSGKGVAGMELVQNCKGSSEGNDGISALMVSTSTGTSGTGTGIRGRNVSSSHGSSLSGGTAIEAFHAAIGCTVGSGAVVSPNKLLGTP